MKKIAACLTFCVTVAFALASIPAFAADQLHLYNWNNYIAPETVKRFETECKCEVVQTYYSDNEELLAKLAAGAKGYDVLVPTSNAVQSLIRGNQLQPIDQSKLPNLKNVDPAYLMALATGCKVSKIPLAVREIAFSKLRSDQKKSERGEISTRGE